MGKKGNKKKRLNKEKFKKEFPTLDPDRFDAITPEDIKKILRSLDLIKEHDDTASSHDGSQAAE